MSLIRFFTAVSVFGWLGTTALSASAQEPMVGDSSGAAASSALHLDENAAFARARSFYEANDYAACSKTFSELLNPSNPEQFKSPSVIEQARIYYAACLIGLGKDEAGKAQMRTAIRANPLLPQPDRLVFPGKVVDLFIFVRSELSKELRQAEEIRVQQLKLEAEKAKAKDEALHKKTEELERLAATETVIQKNSRWLAYVPFGVGQFQNRDTTLGWLFLSSETLLAGAALTSVSVELGLNSQANGGNTSKDTGEINRRLRLAHSIELGTTAGFLVVATLGVLEANLSFVPEFRLGERRRKTGRSEPEKGVTLTPTAAPLPEGAILGAIGRF